MPNIKALKNLKHILVIGGIVIVLLFSAMSPIFGEISTLFNSVFIYRTGSGTLQDVIYKHNLTPSSDIAIVRIDEASVNALQAQ